MKSKFQILNGIAFVATIVMNYISNTGVFNGATMATISKKYHNLFTPAGYAFSIWGLIYLLLLGFVSYYGPFNKSTPSKDKTISDIGWWFVISCAANSVWVVAWLYEYTLLSALIMMILFVSLMQILKKTHNKRSAPDFYSKLFLIWPFQIYAGWISVALIANMAALLTKNSWGGWGLSATTWTLIMIAIATLIHLVMIWKKNMPTFALVAVWALVAIAVANSQVNATVYWTAIITAVLIFTNTIVWNVKNKQLQ